MCTELCEENMPYPTLLEAFLVSICTTANPEVAMDEAAYHLFPSIGAFAPLQRDVKVPVDLPSVAFMISVLRSCAKIAVDFRLALLAVVLLLR